MTGEPSPLPLSHCFDPGDAVELYAQHPETRRVREKSSAHQRGITVPELMDLVFEALAEMRPARDCINAALGRWHDRHFPPEPGSAPPEEIPPE
jgi:hypothetical protein